MEPVTTAQPKKRKTAEEQKAALLAKKAQIEARLKKLEARAKPKADRKLETRKKIVVGAAMLALAKRPDATGPRRSLLNILRGVNASPTNAKVIAEIITELEALPTAPPSTPSQ